MIKGILATTLSSVLLLSMESVNTFSPAYSAQSQKIINEVQDSISGCTGINSNSGNGCSYIDADGDGICDNCGSPSGICGKGYTDANGDGVCDNYGTQSGNGAGGGGNYTDANGDGVCDYYSAETGRHHGGYGYGGGNGSGGGNGHGNGNGSGGGRHGGR